MSFERGQSVRLTDSGRREWPDIHGTGKIERVDTAERRVTVFWLIDGMESHVNLDFDHVEAA
jgi:transcription antitermination factor NusG